MWRHFKIAYDPALDYAAVCSQLFSDLGKCLCVVEKIDINAHVHFHGETDLTEDVFKNRVSELMKDHWKRKAEPTSRPVRHSGKEANEKGLQYLMKEPDALEHVLYKKNITDEELEELKSASEAHVDELKGAMRAHLHALPDQPEDAEKLHALYRFEGLEYYIAKAKMPPVNFQKLVLYAMALKEPPCKKRKMYVAERI